MPVTIRTRSRSASLGFAHAPLKYPQANMTLVHHLHKADVDQFRMPNAAQWLCPTSRHRLLVRHQHYRHSVWGLPYWQRKFVQDCHQHQDDRHFGFGDGFGGEGS